MKKLIAAKLFLFIFFSLFVTESLAWNYSIDAGYGYSHDPNDSKYHNSGFLLSGDFYPIKRTPLTFWSLNASLGQWHSSAPVNKNVTSAAVSLGLRLYAFQIAHQYPFYFLGTVGPAYISKIRLGTNTQASHATIQTNLGLGAEFNKLDLNFRLAHYSNANLGHPNDGFNILYLLSIGYLF
jgi:hypothetical protein